MLPHRAAQSIFGVLFIQPVAITILLLAPLQLLLRVLGPPILPTICMQCEVSIRPQVSLQAPFSTVVEVVWASMASVLEGLQPHPTQMVDLEVSMLVQVLHMAAGAALGTPLTTATFLEAAPAASSGALSAHILTLLAQTASARQSLHRQVGLFSRGRLALVANWQRAG